MSSSAIPLPAEPQALAPLAEPEQPALHRGSPPPRTPEPREQAHMPVSGGGSSQRPGLLRRWGFLFGKGSR